MKLHDPQRRTFLRSTFAAGVALVLLGCDRKPQTSTASMSSMPGGPSPMSPVPASTSTAAVAPTQAAATPKVSKAIAHYQEQPKGDQQCANCANFIAESKTCKVVEGPISPNGWCIYWFKKA